ncbi:hypothetical protein RJT34_24163 [Clitoria ternatea]|uniref:RING-type domain-containing protein n=1 Tax=Clitoria ternatea TaxID=43366 RepID=A0AAN9FU40_CLITE
MFRRARTEKVSAPWTTHSNGAEKMEKGKAISSKFPSKSSHHGHISALDTTEENGQFQQLKPAFSHRGSKGNATDNEKETKGSIGNSSLQFIADSSNTSRNAFTGKCKLDNKTLPGPNTCMDHGKSISLSNDSQSQSQNERKISLPPRLSTTARCRGHKSLVRNGCISPNNIATRAKQSAEQSRHQTKDVEQSHAGYSVSSNTAPPISIDDIVSEERSSGRAKGKGVLIHPSSHGPNGGTFHSTSSPMINYEETNGTRNAIQNSLLNAGGQGGWRTTHNERKSDHQIYDVDEHHLRRNYTGRLNTNRMEGRNTGSSQSSNVHGSLLDHSAQPTSLILPDRDQSTGTHRPADIVAKRQRKRVSSSGNPNDTSYNSEIMFRGSSGESSSSSRSPFLGPEVVELLPTPRSANQSSEDLYDNNNNSSDARARQVEADEILARELQEQMYHDDSFDGIGFDEHLARELQRAENLLRTSVDSHDIYHPTLIPRTNRQSRTRSYQNPSNRRRAAPQVSFPNRMSRLRSRITSRAPTISSRGRRPQFPLDMDLDMRLDILEALEDAVGDFSDMGMADDIFHARHEFNEDDYEMLLALDEGNHQHTGASANQINSLPQSTIQTDNFTEDCAICLETPVKGETIRHLPCLHKFHKDCIDPWLRRKTSCPVCKSSIT